MTGFGRYESITDEHKLIIEMKSVNHKYCDINIRMPKKLNIFENAIRTIIKKYIKRGKIDIFITYEDYKDGTSVLKFNQNIANEYIRNFEIMSRIFSLDNDITVSSLSRYPEVLAVEEQSADEEEIWKFLEEAIKNAVKKLVETRTNEGKNLKDDIEQKLEYMFKLIEEIKKLSPQVAKAYKERLESRLNEILNEPVVDESRLATEVAIFADKSCIDEEIVRLDSHIKHMQKTLYNDGTIGRKLDFISQEMNREANTILSKANNLDISNTGINLKTEIEKIREQVQNIE